MPLYLTLLSKYSKPDKFNTSIKPLASIFVLSVSSCLPQRQVFLLSKQGQRCHDALDPVSSRFRSLSCSSFFPSFASFRFSLAHTRMPPLHYLPSTTHSSLCFIPCASFVFSVSSPFILEPKQIELLFPSNFLTLFFVKASVFKLVNSMNYSLALPWLQYWTWLTTFCFWK